MALNKVIFAGVKNTEMWLTEKGINVNHSGYFFRNQNSLISRLCTIRIKTGTCRIILKPPTCIMFTIMHRRQEILAIVYFQIILMLRNNEPSCIFYSIHIHISDSTIFHFLLFRISPCFCPSPIFAPQQRTIKSLHVPVDSNQNFSFPRFIRIFVFFSW
jgi:hypothetical protein